MFPNQRRKPGRPRWGPTRQQRGVPQRPRGGPQTRPIERGSFSKSNSRLPGISYKGPPLGETLGAGGLMGGCEKVRRRRRRRQRRRRRRRRRRRPLTNCYRPQNPGNMREGRRRTRHVWGASSTANSKRGGHDAPNACRQFI